LVIGKHIFLGYFPLVSGVAKEGASGGTRPGAQALGSHQHTFCSQLQTHLKQKFGQNTLKNVYFWKKTKTRPSIPVSKGSAPRHLRCNSRLQLNFVEFVSSVKLPSIKNKTAIQ